MMVDKVEGCIILVVAFNNVKCNLSTFGCHFSSNGIHLHYGFDSFFGSSHINYPRSIMMMSGFEKGQPMKVKQNEGRLGHKQLTKSLYNSLSFQ